MKCLANSTNDRKSLGRGNDRLKKDWMLQDPLHEILERHLFRSSTEGENSSQMVSAVIADYMMFLNSQGVHIPGSMREALLEDLKEEIREITIKKTFGAVTIDAPQTKTTRRVI
jgi:hypothetical protein